MRLIDADKLKKHYAWWTAGESVSEINETYKEIFDACIDAQPTIDAGELKERTKAERMVICESLLTSIWDEFVDGDVDEEILQVAVNAQIMCNRIVWKLNERNRDAEIH